MTDTYKFDTKTKTKKRTKTKAKTNKMYSSGFLVSIMANKNSIFITKLDRTSIEIDRFINATSIQNFEHRKIGVGDSETLLSVLHTILWG